MSIPRRGPERQEVEGWIQFSLENLARQQTRREAGQRDQSLYTGMAVNHMTLGRSRYLHGLWFQSRSIRDAVKEARAAFQNAAQCIEMSFRLVYDPALPEYLGNKADWSCVMELDAIEGFTAALMASDFVQARRFARWPRRAPDDDPMDVEVCNYVDALQACLRNDLTSATALLNRNLAKLKQRPPSKGFRLNYRTLSMTLLGIVEKNTSRFNGGLAAHLEFYEPSATHGEEQDTSEEFICDAAVALANLGLWAGLKLHTQHRLLPSDLLISAYPPISK